MAIKTITLLDGTTAYAHDVEDLVNPLYTDIDDTNIRLGAAIQIKKLEASTNVADIIVGNATKVPTYVAMSGDATISATGVLTVTSGIANKLTVTNDITTDAIMYPVWVNASTGNLTPYVSTEFKFNPHNASYADVATLTTDRFIGALTGNADTSTTAANLANGTYSYGSGAIIVDARNASGNAGTVTNGFYTTSSFYLGTTAIAVNRASASQSLTGINIDGSAGSTTNATNASNAANTGTTPASNAELNSNGQCKGWAIFSVDGAGTPTVLASYNVSSVANIGSVTLQVTWDRDFTSANYVTLGTINHPLTGAITIAVEAQAAGTVNLTAWDSGGIIGGYGQTWMVAAFGTLS